MSTVQPMMVEPVSIAQRVCEGDRRAVATALNLLDDRRPAAYIAAGQLLADLSKIKAPKSSHLVGLTGPPGVGKSSLVSALLRIWRRRGKTIGVLAVDPSSPISGGALLGDRLRMMSGELDDGVFVRSLACRGAYGGLSMEVWPMSLVMLAAFDIVLVETVGVGQREIDVSKMADTTCYVAQPASGDSIQFLKAGIMEVPHVLVVNKADLGEPAKRTLDDLRVGLRGRANLEGWQAPAVLVSAATGNGLDALVDALHKHHEWLTERGEVVHRRKRIQAEWIIKRLLDEYGRFGIERLGGKAHILADLSCGNGSLFDQYERLRARFLTSVGPRTD